MGNSSDETFADFLESLKQAGVKIDNEQELKERLAEASHWRYAFRTIAANGRVLGIKFSEPETGSDVSLIQRALDHFRFPVGTQDIFVASLKAQ